MNIKARNEIRIVQISTHLFQSKKKHKRYRIYTIARIQSSDKNEKKNEIFRNYYEHEIQLKNARESKQNENIEIDKNIAKFQRYNMKCKIITNETNDARDFHFTIHIRMLDVIHVDKKKIISKK